AAEARQRGRRGGPPAQAGAAGGGSAGVSISPHSPEDKGEWSKRVAVGGEGHGTLSGNPGFLGRSVGGLGRAVGLRHAFDGPEPPPTPADWRLAGRAL